MTTLSTRPGTQGAHRTRELAGARDHLAHPLDHSPEVLIALAAVLVVLAGPVMHALAPHNELLTGLSALPLLVGLVLAAVAGARLLRG